ncbi:MAG: hypothetical protein A2X22_14090 [Bacteroidetes bacterium GWF2_49_14]|nr:MAG: hypothetical protein A2X22_14090 [Bacteroidetes bacterium GWF2_49_14]HBB91198.1 thioredoxin family protein [Bacteroidales bacterium]
MKTTLSLILGLMFFSGVMAQTTPPSAQSVLDEALAVAKVENKNVCIMFHASWCGWCKRMDSIMNMPVNKPYFEANWVIRHLVVAENKPDLKKNENPGGMELLVKYATVYQGIPYWLVFNPKGQLLFDSKMPAKDKTGMDIRTNTGCPAAADEVEYFEYVMKHTTKLTAEEISKIGATFLLKR